jgi:hypothetical protein
MRIKNWETKLILVALVFLALAMLAAFIAGRDSENSDVKVDQGYTRYVSRDPYECQLIDFRCEANEEVFVDETGCGCKSDDKLELIID